MNFLLQGSTVMRFYDTAYLTDQKNSIIYSPLLNQENAFYISGNGVNVNVSKSINSSIGEYFERLTMFENNKLLFLDNIELPGISLKTGIKIKLTNDEIIAKKLFLDTCGLSSHIKSNLCIDNSFNEFIERQSFIYNYLSKSPGELIDKRLYSYFYNTPCEFKEIKFYNISLISNYYVILAIVIKRDDVWLGLGSSVEFKDALLKSIKEIQQFYLSSKLNGKNKQNKLYNKGDYANTFSKLTSYEIKEAYEYLLDSPTLYKSNHINSVTSMKSIINELYIKCGIEPYIFFLQLNQYNLYKVCQIVDLNWFPSLNPKWYPEEVYSFVENRMKVKLNHRCNFIPFP
jgi:hypothetical protein